MWKIFRNFARDLKFVKHEHTKIKRMKHIFHYSLILLVSLAMLTGCKADLDYDNIDGQTSVQMGLVLPIGTVTSTAQDLLGIGKMANHLFINENHILAYRDTFSTCKQFHPIDLTLYGSTSEHRFYPISQIPSGVIPGGSTTTLNVPFTLVLDSLNKPKHLDDERFDSILIQSATFTNTITENLSMNWDWVDKIQIQLGSDFTTTYGSLITVYDKHTGPEDADFNTPIPTTISNFSINLMKDRTAKPDNTNVKQDVELTILLTLSVPSGQDLTFGASNYIQFAIETYINDYYAIWGMFSPSKEMHDETTIVMKNEFAAWEDFERMKLPFHEPKVDARVTTQVAGPLYLSGKYVNATSATGEFAQMSFNGNPGKGYIMGEYGKILPTDPSTIGDSAIFHIPFDNSDANGHLDNLFRIRMDSVHYKFEFDFYRQEKHVQGRLTPNTSVRMEAALEAPMSFNENAEISYTDTATNFFRGLSLDSLLKNTATIKDTEYSDLLVGTIFSNEIPMDIRVSISFIDENGNTIMDKVGGKDVVLRITERDTVSVPAPELVAYGGTKGSYVKSPGKATEILQVNKDKLDKLQAGNRIVYHYIIDDQSIPKTLNPSLYPVRIIDTSSLNIHIGAAANVKAILDFSKQNNKH